MTNLACRLSSLAYFSLLYPHHSPTNTHFVIFEPIRLVAAGEHGPTVPAAPIHFPASPPTRFFGIINTSAHYDSSWSSARFRKVNRSSIFRKGRRIYIVFLTLESFFYIYARQAVTDSKVPTQFNITDLSTLGQQYPPSYPFTLSGCAHWMREVDTDNSINFQYKVP